MQEIFNFIKEYWELVVAVLTLIVSVIIAAIRKKPVSSIYGDLYDVAIDACKEAEKSLNKGSEKMAYAVSYACTKLGQIYPGIRAEKYMALIAFIIERLLTTPQKKGE